MHRKCPYKELFRFQKRIRRHCGLGSDFFRCNNYLTIFACIILLSNTFSHNSKSSLNLLLFYNNALLQCTIYRLFYPRQSPYKEQYYPITSKVSLSANIAFSKFPVAVSTNTTYHFYLILYDLLI